MDHAFPDGFLFGTSTAAYQIEGGWNEDGTCVRRSLTASHVNVNNPRGSVVRRKRRKHLGPFGAHPAGADQGRDQRRRGLRFLSQVQGRRGPGETVEREAARAHGRSVVVTVCVLFVFGFGTQLKYYRFSISWARVAPSGEMHTLNRDGLEYYDRLVDEIIANDMFPMVHTHGHGPRVSFGKRYY